MIDDENAYNWDFEITYAYPGELADDTVEKVFNKNSEDDDVVCSGISASDEEVSVYVSVKAMSRDEAYYKARKKMRGCLDPCAVATKVVHVIWEEQGDGYADVPFAPQDGL